ncbi:MAG: hypothetical protein L3K07_01530 [Thermoplasmata archaeon]|nr:hypothetical protein [Thermoplasmata archaeon]
MSVHASAPTVPTGPVGEAPEQRRGTHVRTLGIPLLILLAAEFLLGMALNLFGSLPGGSALTVLESSPILVLHIILGVLLVGTSARVLALGRRLRDRRATASGALALLSSLLAFLAGMAFTFNGGSAAASYLMSVGFTGVLVGAALLLVPRPYEGVDRTASSETPTRKQPTPGGGP